MKSLFATFLILGVCFLSCKKNDSYKKNEVFKFEKLQGLDKGNKLRILDSLNNNIQTKDRDSSALNLLLDLSTEYYFLNERKKSLQVTLQALEIANKINDSLKVAKSYYYIGDSYENNLKDSAYYYYLKAEKLYFNLQQIEKVARMQFNKGYILFFEGNYTECEVELIKALNNLKESKNSELKYYVLNLLGICQEKLEDYEAALKYHELALK